MNKKEEELIAKVVDLFTSQFTNKAILRGGMVLKILGSNRYTNDLDYLFVPYESKKDVVKEVLTCLKKIPSSTTSYSLNSQSLRIVLNSEGISIQIEIKVALEVKTSVISTRLYSPQFNLPKRLIPIVDHGISLANKLCAWNERRLARDIYDIWFFLQMNIEPDLTILESRLKNPQYSKLIKPTEYFKGVKPTEFYEFLRENISLIPDKKFEKEFLDYLTPSEIEGLMPLIRSSLVKLR